jgi:hypothetical protein
LCLRFAVNDKVSQKAEVVWGLDTTIDFIKPIEERACRLRPLIQPPVKR